MNWVFGVAAIIVAVAAVSRLLWWASGRSHRLAGQGQSSAQDSKDVCETAHVPEEANRK